MFYFFIWFLICWFMGLLALFYSFFVVFVLCLGYFVYGFWALSILAFLGLMVWVKEEICFKGKEFWVCYPFAFWLFILGELIAFLTLFVVCLWCDTWGSLSISDWFELPLLGCFLLIGSSITASAFHYCSRFNQGFFLLLLTIFLGCGFIILQLKEFYDCECDFTSSAYYAASFCTVGLHFSHVLMGVLGLLSILYVGLSNISRYYIDLIVWYWHFVDYIWLLVFIVIYVP